MCRSLTSALGQSWEADPPSEMPSFTHTLVKCFNYATLQHAACKERPECWLCPAAASDAVQPAGLGQGQCEQHCERLIDCVTHRSIVVKLGCGAPP